MQEKEDSEESRDGNWATASSGAVEGAELRGGAVKRVTAGGNHRGVCLHGAEMLRAFCLFAA